VTGSPNKLEMPPAAQQAAIDRIRSEVDKHPDRRWIYIAGHADYRGGPKLNYPLSEGRATFVAEIIRRHLNVKQLVEGQDYRLYIERRGDADCQQPRTDDEYLKSCRKIVIRFMHALREPAFTARAGGPHVP
jgi:outer membrane protein OmpA-like peptidoglycan-associated protein